MEGNGSERLAGLVVDGGGFRNMFCDDDDDDDCCCELS